MKSKKTLIFAALFLALVYIMPMAGAAFSDAEAANAAIESFYASLPKDEADQREIDLVYPDEFGGMYVDEETCVVVCIVGDIDSVKQYYIDEVAGGDESRLRFQTVERTYDLLDQYYVTIEAKHVSTRLIVINLYKVKSFEINSRDNRVDVWLYTEEPIEVADYMHGIFGEGIYIYFTEEDGNNVVMTEDEAYAQAELDADNAPKSELSEEPTVSEQMEEAGINAKNIVIPIVIVAVILVAVLAIAKLRSRNTDLDMNDEDE